MGGVLLLRELVRGDVALAYAAEIAAKNPHTIRAGKRLLNLPLDTDPLTILKAESEEQTGLIGSANQIEAVMANVQKRAPVFGEAG
jgi:enoyl-CoA hydratase/carnithine racemase